MAGDGRAPTPTGLRVVMFPFPFGRHITQMLQLGELLLARGLGVTVLHTAFNAPDPTCHPELTFVSIRESLPADVVACPDMVEQMMALNAACEAPFQAALAEQLARGGHQALQGPGEVAYVVVDGQWYKMLGAATLVAVPALALRADGAATFLSMLATPRLVADGYLPIRHVVFLLPFSVRGRNSVILCHRLLMTQAKQCAAEGGAASLALDGLVEYISSL